MLLLALVPLLLLLRLTSHAKAAHAAATVCAIGHNAKALPGPSGWTPKDWPTWPDEVEYNATGAHAA